MVKTAVVFLTWNRLPVLKNTINTFLKYNKYNDSDIIIVDNGSTDGTQDYLKTTSFDIVLNKINYGAQMGKYIGWNRAENRGYDYILFIEDDHPSYRTVPIKELEKYLDKNEDVGIIRLNNKKYLKRHQITHLPIIYYPKEKLNNKFKIFKCNYHMTSHPSIFRTSLVEKLKGCVYPKEKKKFKDVKSLGFEKFRGTKQYEEAKKRCLMDFGVLEKEYMRLYLWNYNLTAQIKPSCFRWVDGKRANKWKN